MSVMNMGLPSAKTHSLRIKEPYGRDLMNVVNVGGPTAIRQPSPNIREHTWESVFSPMNVMNVGRLSARSSPSLNISALPLGEAI